MDSNLKGKGDMNAEIQEPSIIFRISKLYSPNCSETELYDLTRGRWVLGSKREEAQLAFSVYKNTILEVYEIGRWYEGGTTPSTRKDTAPKGRWEFVGEIAQPEIREKYIGKSVVNYFNAGSRNPVRYINI